MPDNHPNHAAAITPLPALPPPASEGFVSKEVLALRLSRSVRTVENWQRRGILPYVKCGRSILFKWTEVESHLRKHFRAKPRRTLKRRAPKPSPTQASPAAEAKTPSSPGSGSDFSNRLVTD